MPKYGTLDHLFAALSCIFNSPISNWNHVWNLALEDRGRCFRFILEDLLEWPSRLVDLQSNISGTLYVSSAFSGSGMAELCGHKLNEAMDHELFIPTVWIEKDAKAAFFFADCLTRHYRSG